METSRRHMPAPAIRCGRVGAANRSAFFAILVAAPFSLACTTQEAAPVANVVVAGADRVLFVRGGSSGADADGSKDRPFATLGAAASKATSGTAILVAAGTYTESIVLAAGVTVIGQGAVTLSPTAAAAAITADANGGFVDLQHIRIAGAAVAGVNTRGVHLRLVDCIIENTRNVATASAETSWVNGHGIHFQGSPSSGETLGTRVLELVKTRVVGNGGVGVLAVHAAQVVIRGEGTDSPRPKPATGGEAGIILPDFLPDSRVEDNQLGGVAIILPDFKPQDQLGIILPDFLVAITGTAIRRNVHFGVDVRVGDVAAQFVIARSLIANTFRLATADAADGLVVADTQKATGKGVVTVKVGQDVVLAGHERAGAIFASKAQIVGTFSGVVSACSFGGLWAEGASVAFTLTNTAIFHNNVLIGAGFSGGASAQIDRSVFSHTQPYTYSPPMGGTAVQFGDGLGVFNQAKATAIGASFLANDRAGIVAFQPSGKGGIVAKDCQFQGGKFGVAIGGKTAAADYATGDFDAKALNNAFEGTGSQVQLGGNLCVIPGRSAAATGCL